MSDLLLHPENLFRVPFVGRRLVRDLEQRAREALAQPADPAVGVTVLIRTKNDKKFIGGIMDDLRANQEYFRGKVQVVLVDTESTDGTVEIAQRYNKFFDITVVSIKQKDFNYATSLNVGFEAAKHEPVFMIVGHSRLTNKATLAAVAQYANRKEFAGGYCWPMPSATATLADRLQTITGPMAKIHKPACLVKKASVYIMGANCALVRRSIWKELGGYNERYGAGGEDWEFGVRAMAAGYKVMIDPALTVYHSHELSFVEHLRQIHYWQTLTTKPNQFDASALAKYRKDLRTKNAR
jgi:GT2 family glycosyltransferase